MIDVLIVIAKIANKDELNYYVPEDFSFTTS